MKTPAAAAALCLAAALAWTVAFRPDGRWEHWNPIQGLVVTGGLIMLATAALVAMVVRGSGWGRRLAGGLAVGQLGLAMFTTPSPWWWVGVGLSGATLAMVGGPWAAASGRRRVAQLGPPPRAVLLLCLLAGLPVAMAAVSVNGLGGGWVWVGLSAVTAAAYTKALPSALFSARFLIPAATVAAAFTTPWPGWTAVLLGGGGTTWAAWSKDARLAVQPLTDRGPPPTPSPTPLRIRSASPNQPSNRSEKGEGTPPE